MKRFPELRPNFWDGLVLTAVLALAIVSGLVVWGGGEQTAQLTAVISVDGQVSRQVNLSALTKKETTVLAVQGYELQLVLDREGAEVISSTCPTQDCVHTGKITRPGQSIVCLPARVTVQLQGTQGQNDLDAVLG